ncbi:MAG: oxetanocin [Hadesarchaea archaeon CG08_land_8_20_14_0_20_51_8]|nr:MAG: oxetanocin [Hadesarchaea archaeon CG08_land_8_20_14_0_20_51_8]
MKLRELLEQLNNLKCIPRTGWLLCNVSLNQVEDVAQHTFDVVVITFLLANELEHKKLNLERALGMAVMHDWAEASVGDFPNTALKYLESPDIKKRMEKSALEELFIGLKNKEKCMKLWHEYCEKRTIESKIVHSADYLSMLVQALKYRERGNRSRQLDRLWRAVKSDLAPYAAEFKPVRELVAELSELPPFEKGGF